MRLKTTSGAPLLALAPFLALVPPLGAQPAPSNLSALKGEMKVFEAVVDETLAQTFTPPFGLLEKTQGTYLPGFGLAFSLEVNLYPLRTPNPFDARPLSKAELAKAHEARLERISTIKESVPRLLADHATSLRSIGTDDEVAVVVHLFEVQPGTDDLPGQLVIEARKSDLDDYWGRKISYPQLLAKMKMLEL